MNLLATEVANLRQGMPAMVVGQLDQNPRLAEVVNFGKAIQQLQSSLAVLQAAHLHGGGGGRTGGGLRLKEAGYLRPKE